ncbi:MAG: pseudouridine synthase [Desulfuromonas sp.]|nr:MAG: pseudouridine synthase [Desulfuromonas sp.]
MTSAERLHKVMAAAGYCSRRQAEQLIAAGRVTVDGRVAVIGEKVTPSTEILVDGRSLGDVQRRYYVLLHKPVGVVSTLSDPQGRQRVVDLVRDIPARLYPVGRLDLTTSGLLLLTNDGDLAQRLAHPRHEIDKTYLVRVRGHLDRQAVSRLEQGVRLEDGLTAPAKVAALRNSGSHCWFELTIHEGRNRQVRRMCESLGYPVSRLARIGYAFLTLDGLEPGAYRLLTDDEVARLKVL